MDMVRKIALVAIMFLLCVFCFIGCAPQQEPVETETGTGIVQKDPYESVGDPTKTPAFVFIISIAGVIGVSAAAVLITDARRKQD